MLQKTNPLLPPKLCSYVCLLLYFGPVLFANVGCVKEEGFAKKTEEELVQIILVESRRLDESRKPSFAASAVKELESRKAWESLVLTLPPRGGFGPAMDVVDAISNIGNADAIPFLEEVHKTDELVSGEFWVSLEVAIEKLKDKTKVPGTDNETDTVKIESKSPE